MLQRHVLFQLSYRLPLRSPTLPSLASSQHADGVTDATPEKLGLCQSTKGIPLTEEWEASFLKNCSGSRESGREEEHGKLCSARSAWASTAPFEVPAPPDLHPTATPRAAASRAETNRAEPSRVEPSRAESSRAESSRVESSPAQALSLIHI